MVYPEMRWYLYYPSRQSRHPSPPEPKEGTHQALRIIHASVHSREEVHGDTDGGLYGEQGVRRDADDGMPALEVAQASAFLVDLDSEQGGDERGEGGGPKRGVDPCADVLLRGGVRGLQHEHGLDPDQHGERVKQRVQREWDQQLVREHAAEHQRRQDRAARLRQRRRARDEVLQDRVRAPLRDVPRTSEERLVLRLARGRGVRVGWHLACMYGFFPAGVCN